MTKRTTFSDRGKTTSDTMQAGKHLPPFQDSYFNHHTFFKKLILPCIFFIALTLRVQKIINFKIYVDSFKFLFIAKAVSHLEWINEYFPQYPEFNNTTIFTPYKWLFGFLIGTVVKFLNIIGFEMTNSLYEIIAHTIVITSSMLTILLIAWLIYWLTKDKFVTITTSALFAFSGAQIIWSGFLITDTIAGLIVLLYLAVFLKGRCEEDKMTEKKKWLYYGKLLLIGLLMYFCRPELVIIPALLEIVDWLYLRFKKKTALLIKIFALLWVSITVYSFLVSKLFTRNLWGDIGLWIILFLGTIFLVFDTKKKLPKMKTSILNKEKTLALISSWLILSVLSLIYVNFNPDISRYINILLPLMVLIAGIETSYILKRLKNKFNKNYYNPITAGLLITFMGLHIIYTYHFKPIETKDYFTEQAELVLRYAEENDYNCIHSISIEALLWENSNDKIEINEINNKKPIMDENSLIIIDEGLGKMDIDIDKTNLKLISRYKTKAAYWIGNERERQGWFEIWVADN